MMSDYTPDRWILVQMESESDKVTKILSGWIGGYLGADEWRLSSGVTEIIDMGNHYEIHNESGSVYTCVKHREGTTAYTAGILNKWVSKWELASGDGDIKINIITVEDYQMQ